MEFVPRTPVRRQDDRVDLLGPVRAFRTDASGASGRLSELTDVTAADISAGGMRLSTSSDVETADWVALVFAFSEVPYRMLGKVLWKSLIAGGMVEFAVRFEHLALAANPGLGPAIAQTRFRTRGFIDRRRVRWFAVPPRGSLQGEDP